MKTTLRPSPCLFLTKKGVEIVSGDTPQTPSKEALPLAMTMKRLWVLTQRPKLEPNRQLPEGYALDTDENRFIYYA